MIIWALRIENRARLTHFCPKNCHFWQTFICVHSHSHKQTTKALKPIYIILEIAKNTCPKSTPSSGGKFYGKYVIVKYTFWIVLVKNFLCRMKKILQNTWKDIMLRTSLDWILFNGDLGILQALSSGQNLKCQIFNYILQYIYHTVFTIVDDNISQWLLISLLPGVIIRKRPAQWPQVDIIYFDQHHHNIAMDIDVIIVIIVIVIIIIIIIERSAGVLSFFAGDGMSVTLGQSQIVYIQKLIYKAFLDEIPIAKCDVTHPQSFKGCIFKKCQPNKRVL